MALSSPAERPALLLPFLAPFYDLVVPLSWPLIRIVWGVDLAIHGWEKMVRLPAIASSLISTGSAAPLGAQFDAFHNIVLSIFEFGGGICIALGLFTRFFAPAAAIDLAIITFTVFWSKGYHAYEYTLWWGLTTFAISLRGGGPYSLDRLLKREL
jgi:putative oxidoreductase